MRPLGLIVAGLMVVGLALIVRPAAAYTGTQLLEFCSTSEDTAGHYNAEGLCQGFVAGVAMTWEQARFEHEARSTFCLPEGVTVDQIRRAAEKYMNEHPEQLYRLAHVLVLWALEEAFPCE